MQSPQRYRLLDLHIDLARQRVSRDGTALDVQGLSFRLLACLLQHGDAVVDFDTLMAEVWAPAVVGEETVTQRVKLLRQSLGDDGRQPRYIRSVRGRGYQLCELPQVDGQTVLSETSTPPRHRRRNIAVIVTVVVALASSSLWLTLHRAAPPKPPTAAQELSRRAAYYASIGQRDNNERAVALYTQALTLAPADMAAQIGLSRAYSARVCLYNFPYEWAVRAQRLAEAVTNADPHRADAWSVLAYAHDCLGEMQAAIVAYEHAVALDPADDPSRASVAYLYQEQGRLVDALHANMDMHGDAAKVRFRDVQIARELDLLGFHDAAEKRFRRSFELNPDSVFSNIALPQHLFLQGRFAEAQAVLDQAMTRNTPHVALYQLAGELALLRGDRKGAEAAFAKAVQLRPQMSLPTTLVTLYGEQPPSTSWLDERIAAMRSQPAGVGYPSDRLELVLLQWARGQHKEAMETLSVAVQIGYIDRAYLQTSPLFQPMAGEPAYAAAIDTISQRAAAQHAQVLAADWRPAELGSHQP